MRVFVVVCSVISLLLAPIVVHAEDAPSNDTITLHPATVAMTIAAGEVTLQTVYFTNKSGEKKTFTVLRSDYAIDPKDGKTLVFTEPSTASDSVQPMLDVTPITFDLDAGETQELLVRIRPDATTKPGQYKGALFVGPTATANGSNSIQVVGRVGTIIGVSVTGASVPIQAGTTPVAGRPSALIIALLIFSIFAFAGAGLASARKAQQLRQQQKLY